MRSRNTAANTVASVFGLSLNCLVVLALMAHLVSGETTPKELNIPEAPWRDWMLSWKKSWVLTVAAFRQSYIVRCFYVTAFVVALGQINDLPATLHGHQNTNPYAQTVLTALMASAAQCATWALWLTVVCWSCSVLSRMVFPERIPYERLLSWRALRTKGFAERVAVGLALMGFHAVFFSVFYWVAEGLGAWSPTPISYGGLLSGYLPWASALNIGFLAAVGEELVYRVFAITWLKRLGTPNWLAVLIPALLWGFQHCFYPQQPFFVRGLELTLVGIVYGIVFLRWGPVPGLVAHFSWNAYAGSSVLIKSHDPYLMISGVAIAGALVWVLLAALALRNKKGILEPEPFVAKVLPPAEAAPTRTDLVALRSTKQPVTEQASPKLWPAVVVAILCLGASVAYHQQVPPLAPITVSAADAQSKAREELERLGLNVEEHRVDIKLYDGLGNAGQYLWERGGLHLLRTVYPKTIPSAIWQVRYFQTSVLEEYFVRIDAVSGKVIYFHARIPDDKAGASLNAQEAEKLARELVERRTGHKPGRTTSASAETYENRVDHRFGFVVEGLKGLNVGQAKVLESVLVVGDVPQSYHRYLELKDHWLRKQQIGHWWQTVGKFLASFCLGLVVCYGVYLGLKRIVGAEPQAKTLARLLQALIGLKLLELMANIPLGWTSYSTEQHPWSFWAARLSNSLEFVIFLAVLVCVLWLSVATLMPAWLVPTPDQKRMAIPLALLGAAARCGVEVFRYLVSDVFHGSLGLELPDTTDPTLVFPLIHAFSGAFAVGIVVTLCLGFVAGVTSRVPTAITALGLLGLVLGLMLGTADSLGELGPSALFYSAGLVTAVWLWRQVLQKNALAWFQAVFLYSLIDDAIGCLGHPVHSLQGWMILGFGALWCGFWWRQSR